jgi:hypothetical protein
LLLCYPIFIAFFLKKNHEELDSDEYRMKYEKFYSEVAVVNREAKNLFYYPFFLIKRWFLSMLIVFMGTNTGL